MRWRNIKAYFLFIVERCVTNCFKSFIFPRNHNEEKVLTTLSRVLNKSQAMTQRVIRSAQNLCSKILSTHFSGQHSVLRSIRTLIYRTQQLWNGEKTDKLGACGGHSFTGSTNFERLFWCQVWPIKQWSIFVRVLSTPKVFLDHSIPAHEFSPCLHGVVELCQFPYIG